MSLHISLLISAFHHFLQMIEPLTWSEHQTLAKPSTFPLRNHYLLLPEEKKTSVFVSYLYLAENTWEHFDQKNFYFSLFNKVWLFCSKLIGMHSVSFLWEKGSAERHKKRQLEPDGILSDRLSIPFYSFCINYLYWTNIFSNDNFRLWSRRKKQLKSFDYYLYMDMQKRFRIDAGNRKS